MAGMGGVPELGLPGADAAMARLVAAEGVRRVIFDEFESAYLPEVDGWKYRDWLQAMSDHAAKTIEESQLLDLR
jgi:hypothetical protein